MKKMAAGIVLSAFAAAGVEAQELRRPRVAPPAVYDVAPGLGHFTDDVLFGEVWLRKELAPRDRSLVTVAALVSTGKTGQIPGHVRRALDNGVKPEEIGELIYLLGYQDTNAFYRAFREWEGVTPAQWRELRASGQADTGS
jgi:4-carboxymuconolactone decarboxylase